MRNIKPILVVLGSLLLSSCVVNSKGSSIKVPSIPDSVDISAINTRVNPNSSTESTYDEKELEYNHLIIEDHADKYYIGETFSNMLRGMHHKRIKYHDDLVQEFGKKQIKDLIPKPIVAQPALDMDLEANILHIV